MNPHCARCGKIIYATERVNCLDKPWHKACFHCEVCRMPLNMKNYKGYDKKPYCNAHYPKQSFTTVTDTPENLRLRQQSVLQSQVKYRKDFEASKGRAFRCVLDTPELHRLRRAQELTSTAKYRQDCDLIGSQMATLGATQGGYVVRSQTQPESQTAGRQAHKGVHQYIMEMAHRPGVIVAPVLPGAYYPKAHTLGHTHTHTHTKAHTLGHSYMHQTSMHSLRSMQHCSHPSVYRALYDYVSQDTDEVSFVDGDIILSVQPIDGGWVYGTVERTGRSGMLPANYIQGLR